MLFLLTVSLYMKAWEKGQAAPKRPLPPNIPKNIKRYSKHLEGPSHFNYNGLADFFFFFNGANQSINEDFLSSTLLVFS